MTWTEFPFDDTDADAVFGAAPGSEPVPEELRDVAELVHVARSSGLGRTSSSVKT